MADMHAPHSPTTETMQAKIRHIVTASPVPVVILPPAHVLMPVSVPEPLATDLRTLHAREMSGRAAAGFLVQDFDQWVLELLKDVVYGRGVDHGELADARREP